jgi:hypothetical protein
LPVVVDLVAEKDDLLVLAEHPRAVVGRLARTKVDDGEFHPSKVTLSPSRIGVFGKTRFVGHSSRNIGPTIAFFSASSQAIVSITPCGAMIGTSSPATSCARPA